ncbi:hypothetical protein ABBQ32_002529 [Trebouxia sp. C0010 RCD-2024]
MELLNRMSSDNVEEVTAEILGSKLIDELQELAEQIINKAMNSPDDAANCCALTVGLMEGICHPGTCHTAVTEPLGGNTGPGKAFRLALVQVSMDIFDVAVSNLEALTQASVPTDQPQFLQFVNWKLIRDTALNYCLKRLLSHATETQVPDLYIEVAAELLLAVDPWMEQNWSYTSRRYLDAYYLRLQRYCTQQIALSMTPEGRFIDYPFFKDIMETFVKPRMQWISAQREKMSDLLDLPAVDSNAAEAAGKTHAMDYISSLSHLQPAESFNQAEQDYSSANATTSSVFHHPQPTNTQSATDVSMKHDSTSSSSASALSLFAPRSCGSRCSDQDSPHRPTSSRGSPFNSKETPSNSGVSCSSTHTADGAESVQAHHEAGRPDTTAQLDTLSSNPNDQDPELYHRSTPDSHMTEEPACLTEAVGRSLQEFMLTHDSTEFTSDIQALLRGSNAAGVLEAVLLCASAKLEQVSWTRTPLAGPTPPYPKTRHALLRHMEQQRDRLFCRGGTIDPQAPEAIHSGAARSLRSRPGLPVHPSNRGYRFMVKWGWEEGKGLGANLQGRTEPYFPAYQPMEKETSKQGLGEARYKGLLKGDAAADQLRGVVAMMCSGPLRAAVGQGFQAFLTNTPPPTGSRVHPVRSKALCWVGTILSTLVAQSAITHKQAATLINIGVRASARPGSSTAKQLTRSVWAAAAQQEAAIRQGEAQVREAKHKEARQLAQLHQPQTASKKTTYITGPGGKMVRVKIKQYGGAESAGPTSNGRVSWE